MLLEGMTRSESGILFIHDLDRFLSKKEALQLDGALAQAVGRK
jgi:hypothetical protein